MKEVHKIAIVHVHIFKNAGTSFDWILKKNFNQSFHDHRKPKLMKKGKAKYLKSLYTEDEKLIALSSHHIPFNPKEIEDKNLKVLPVYFMREPMDRMLSVYKFEKKQKDIETDGSVMAKKMDFPEYIEWSIDKRKARTLKNMNTMFASGIRNVKSDTEFKHACENLKNTQLMGVVDRFDESMVVFEDELKNYFPDINLAYVSQNVNQKEQKPLSEKIDEVKSLLEEDLFQRAEKVNKNDIDLYKFANTLLDQRIQDIENFQEKLSNFKDRCQVLANEMK